jgi:hypothetical protein
MFSFKQTLSSNSVFEHRHLYLIHDDWGVGLDVNDGGVEGGGGLHEKNQIWPEFSNKN